jgi:peptidyl-prolyl cis-trans isomerase SurA
MDQMVWTKAVNDTLGLETYHKDHRQEYMWGVRSEALLVTTSSEANLAGIRKAHKKIAKGKLTQEDLNASFCSNDTLECVTVESLLVEEGENALVDAMKGQTGLGPVVSSDEGEQFVILVKQRNPEPKELDEARGQITSDYQNYLEEQWIIELREKYPVEVEQSLLDRIKEES